MINLYGEFKENKVNKYDIIDKVTLQEEEEMIKDEALPEDLTN